MARQEEETGGKLFTLPISGTCPHKETNSATGTPLGKTCVQERAGSEPLQKAAPRKGRSRDSSIAVYP